ncbi:6-hydroxymethylpterin diphosphokinase MptE-like protein [Acidianus sp. HS-5]|uniref:6-hydroxymethylpterin diphosphokinase MptE-like protein n=1 Tax=Acidianus sp. HS-5 TaxID=2886040 RepID=UPI001F1A614C|nr:6-hydroxymethylpterin diphosphokinase MptE-like protein [Acidianus sp. HS-5]BDC18123.1 hypothetical protein HS5_10130 [Acidianus sp. HS-5]
MKWISFYSKIREWLRFSYAKDYYSASLLNQTITEDYTYLLDEIRGKKVAIVGAGPSLTKIKEIDADVIISADGATNYLVSKGVIPDIVVTDLDGIEIFPDKTVYVVLAHGDNITRLGKVKEMKYVIGTCQVMPFGRLKLFGGFTDGDRAVILAKKFNPEKILLYAMDFDSDYIGKFSKPWYGADVPISWIKREKLKIAKNIVNEVLQ